MASTSGTLPPVDAVTDAPMPMQLAFPPAAPSAAPADETRTSADITVVSTILLNIWFSPLAAAYFAATAATLLLRRKPHDAGEPCCSAASQRRGTRQGRASVHLKSHTRRDPGPTARKTHIFITASEIASKNGPKR